jgi:hypothetical protein
MAGRSKETARGKKLSTPRSRQYADAGIKTANDFASMMSALMSDLIDGRIGSDVGNAVCNAGGKMLKVVEMQHRYGKQNPAFPHQGKMLQLVELTTDDRVN